MTQLYISDAGQKALMQAQTNGIALQVAGYILGSGYGYTPAASTSYPPVAGVPYSNTSQSSLQGTQVYPNPGSNPNYVPISNYHLQADGVTGAFSVILPLNVGNFTFGEIGIILTNGVFFGIAVLSSPQPKTATVPGATGNIIQLSLTFTAQGTIPTINLNNPSSAQSILATVQDVDVITSGPSGQTTNEILSQNLDEFGRATLLVEQDANDWQASQYDWTMFNGTVGSLFSDKTLVDTTGLVNVASYFPTTGRWVIRFTSGALRGQLRQAIPAPTWTSGTIYKLNYIVQASSVPNPNAYYYCTTAGTSGTTEPTWPTVSGNTVNDNGVVWTYNPGTVSPSNSVIWNGSTGSANASGTTYQLLRASSFSGLFDYIREYMMYRQGIDYFHRHD